MKSHALALLALLVLSFGCSKDEHPDLMWDEPAWSEWADRACECQDAGCAKLLSKQFWALPERVRLSVGRRLSERGKACLEPHGGLTLD